MHFDLISQNMNCSSVITARNPVWNAASMSGIPEKILSIISLFPKSCGKPDDETRYKSLGAKQNINIQTGIPIKVYEQCFTNQNSSILATMLISSGNLRIIEITEAVKPNTNLLIACTLQKREQMAGQRVKVKKVQKTDDMCLIRAIIYLVTHKYTHPIQTRTKVFISGIGYIQYGTSSFIYA
ncbi:hypothetical protein LOAG_12281 [Loa loa]|uniref:Uncharacterized protein n=1 Tax=Loa loa TaxID=7209 RepID=A0A1S0TLI3_LOALO|nr:hypothetical protein LOAG_12281 [Loa loa]EFO16226.1 hypothetical protein LOAG_12281 [Loa loa]